jgi:hypothetical protein
VIEDKTDRPWTPTGMELAKGDRVVVRLNGECRTWCPPLEGMEGAEEGIWAEHDAAADGLVGTVEYVDSDAEDGHPYEVRVDEPWVSVVPGGHAFRTHTDLFARAELDRVPDHV